MATEIWVNIGLGNGLLPDGTKPLPKPMLTDHQWSPSDIHTKAISQKMPLTSITKICLKITHLKLHSNFPGANELTVSAQVTTLYNEFENYTSKISATCPRGQWVNVRLITTCHKPLTHWPLGDLNEILDKGFSSFYKLILVIDGWGV